MTTINLRDFYHWYTQDEYMEVSDDVAEALRASVRYEAAYQRRVTRNKAQYSLDCEDGIEYSACLHEPTPDEVLEIKERFCRLWNALNSLPEIQGRRFKTLASAPSKNTNTKGRLAILGSLPLVFYASRHNVSQKRLGKFLVRLC